MEFHLSDSFLFAVSGYSFSLFLIFSTRKRYFTLNSVIIKNKNSIFLSSDLLNFSVCITQQEISYMYNLNSIDISTSKFIQCDYIFRIMIFDFQKIFNFSIRLFWQIATNLYIDPLITFHCNKINFLFFIFSNINLITSSPQFKINNIF